MPCGFTVVGFSFSGDGWNRGSVFLNLADFKDRKGPGHRGPDVVEKLRGPLAAIPGGLVIPFSPPAVQGLGQFGGFTFELEDLGGNNLQTLADTAKQVRNTGKHMGQLTR